jgi:hypothetical protein
VLGGWFIVLLYCTRISYVTFIAVVTAITRFQVEVALILATDVVCSLPPCGWLQTLPVWSLTACVSFNYSGEECSWKVHLVALPSEDKAGELQRQLLLQQAKVRTFPMWGGAWLLLLLLYLCWYTAGYVNNGVGECAQMRP